MHTFFLFVFFFGAEKKLCYKPNNLIDSNFSIILLMFFSFYFYGRISIASPIGNIEISAQEWSNLYQLVLPLLVILSVSLKAFTDLCAIPTGYFITEVFTVHNSERVTLIQSFLFEWFWLKSCCEPELISLVQVSGF